MALGMTYEEYWYGDVTKARAFLKAEQERQKLRDEAAWLNGLYVYKALLATVGNIGMKKGEKPNEYPKRPVSSEEPEKALSPEAEQEAERMKLVARLNAVIAARKAR